MYRGLTLHWCHHGKQGLLGGNVKIFRVVARFAHVSVNSMIRQLVGNVSIRNCQLRICGNYNINATKNCFSTNIRTHHCSSSIRQIAKIYMYDHTCICAYEKKKTIVFSLTKT